MLSFQKQKNSNLSLLDMVHLVLYKILSKHHTRTHGNTGSLTLDI
ncbi:putative glycosyltransferase domain protein [Bacteroides fragilis str. Ds-233]|nr:putative glycosyltransferase domain protein [Bacteroides fragilis str. Ds-233]